MVVVVHATPLRLELHRAGDAQPLWRELKPLVCGRRHDPDARQRPDEQFFGGGQQNGVFQFKGRLMEISYSGGWEEGDRPSPAPFYMSDRGYGVLRNTWADGIYDFRSDHYLTTTHAENRFDAYYMVGDDHPRGARPLHPAHRPRRACCPAGPSVRRRRLLQRRRQRRKARHRARGLERRSHRHDARRGATRGRQVPRARHARRLDPAQRRLRLRLRGPAGRGGRARASWASAPACGPRTAWRRSPGRSGTAGTRVQKLDVAWTGKGYQWALDANHDAAQGFLDNSDARPFIWTVMGWAGIQRYAVTWTGDQSGSWDYIRWHVPTLIGSGLSGMNYSTGDVDGIFGGSPETFTRDLQWKCFTPVLMGMSGWSKAERKHPWWFDEPLSLHQPPLPEAPPAPDALPSTPSPARPRPPARPWSAGIMWDHPDDPARLRSPLPVLPRAATCWWPRSTAARRQAAAGARASTCPQAAGSTTGTAASSRPGPEGRLIDIPVDLATLPVFVRAGAIIPMYPESLYDGQVPPDPLTLDVYPDGRLRVRALRGRRQHPGLSRG